MFWEVVVHPGAVDELAKLPANERTAIDNALDKLRERGTDLPFPHTSAVVDADHLWKLRPRGGDSPWRGPCSPPSPTLGCWSNSY
ncbi:type II toxin-antitoxin system RelE/ParE family toxin [Frankia tisae]|uniref:type II toxin-antitoxin system RelE/ParE family toxin n=1 Tax=Frankia tisae TaxID=2950104 RepID=UPI0021BF0D86|nr:type II toxin-antitoxin system RelE/ParE family toxin [Frankia tisae]